MSFRAPLAVLATTALLSGAALAEGFRSKPGTPRAPAIRVGAEITPPAPAERNIGQIGTIGIAAPPPEALRGPDGASDYGFSPEREASEGEAPPLGGGPRMPWPNK